MNLVALVGRLTKDVELLKTPQGKSVARFTLACKTRERTDFIPCIAWNQTADYLSNYAKKGAMVSGNGHITTGSYDGKDGKKVFTWEITLESASILVNKQENKSEEAVNIPDYNYPF